MLDRTSVAVTQPRWTRSPCTLIAAAAMRAGHPPSGTRRDAGTGRPGPSPLLSHRLPCPLARGSLDQIMALPLQQGARDDRR